MPSIRKVVFVGNSLEGQVAVITGGARGQGRSHALALAGEGADIALIDSVSNFATVPYGLGTEEDLKETRSLVEETGRRCLTFTADVRDGAAITAAVQEVKDQFGRVDIALANAGILSWDWIEEMADEKWQEMLDVNLTGVFTLFRAVAPVMREQRSGRVVATASMAARMGCALIAHYAASKWGVVGLAKSFALEMAPHNVTVNVVAPVSVNTKMIHNPESLEFYAPGVESPTVEDMAKTLGEKTAMDVPWVEPSDITAGIMYLVSEGARYVTGEVLHIAAGRNAWNGI